MTQFAPSTTPVALIVYNRPDHLKQMLTALKLVKPTMILVIADGPKSDADRAGCEACRQLIAEISWPCEIRRNFSDQNLGCRRRISSGISWVFSQFEEAIFIEDDCIPHPTFFRFCDEMLAHYRNDERVRVISGDNFQFGNRFSTFSYYFSLMPHCWGWASWRRAWKYNDVEMRAWPAAEATDFPRSLLPTDKAVWYSRKAFSEAYSGKLNSWAIPWEFSIWQTGGLCVLPDVNLVSNIGFGADATHCKKPDPCANLPAEEMHFPLRHPPTVEHQLDADLAYYDRIVKYVPAHFAVPSSEERLSPRVSTNI